MLNKKMIAVVVSASLGLLVACNSDENTYEEYITNETTNEITNVVEDAVTVDEVKANYIAMAYAAYSDSYDTALRLQQVVDAFIAAPTEANLALAKEAYKATRTPYQQSEIMRWDGVITEGKNLDSDGGPASVDDWEGQVNAWPLDETHIDSIIQGSDTINVQLLLDQNGADDDEANVTTGVHAIEYMLWDADTNGTGPGAGARTAAEFDVAACGDTLCQRRVDYLKAATDLLVADLEEMQAEWSPVAKVTPGSLAYNFASSDLALDYIIGAMHAMATDELAGARMGSGLSLGDPEEEHDCFSDLSHIAIFGNFLAVKNAFYGTYGDISGAGIGDLVKQQDEATYQTFVDAIASIEAKMAQIVMFGENETNPIRFDQIIGQDASGEERQVAQAASDELTALDSEFRAIENLLSLNGIDTSGGGDGD